MASLNPSSVSPIVNDPCGISAMPSLVVVGTCINRKNFADGALLTVIAVCHPAVAGTPSITNPQVGEARLVVPCKT